MNGGAASTLLDVLLGAAREAPGQTVVHVRGDGTEHTVTFAELRDDALRVAGALIAAGVTPGTPLPLVTDWGDAFQPLFWGALAAGAVPVPLAPEPRRIGPVWELLGRPPVAVNGATASVVAETDGAIRVWGLDTLRAGAPPRDLPRPAPRDVAFLQYSSGSTGAPKGVELTHACVLANLRQISAAMAITADDVIATWMPYFHDMGLIGTHLVPMAARLKQVRIEPLSFAKRPALWSRPPPATARPSSRPRTSPSTSGCAASRPPLSPASTSAPYASCSSAPSPSRRASGGSSPPGRRPPGSTRAPRCRCTAWPRPRSP